MNPFDQAIAHVESLSDGPALDPALRVTLNFHPDRVSDGAPILAALARGRVYRSQFATGTSNGGLTARPDFRGPEFVELGERIAVNGQLGPRIIGAAVATGEHDPQSLKYVWHYVARFGAPLAWT